MSSMPPVYNFISQQSFTAQQSINHNSDLIDTSLVDLGLQHYPRQPTQSLPLNYSYVENHYEPVTHQVHAPVPLHLPVSHTRTQSDIVRQTTPFVDTISSFPAIVSQQQHVYSTTRMDPSPSHGTEITPPTLNYYPAAPQQLFPTPSELLSDIHHHQPSYQHDTPESRSYVQPSLPQPARQQTPEDTTAASLNSAANKTESQRKARQRAIAEEIGFTPTDPDTISSHEKKRHYLECLEQYVLYLHEQLRLVQTPPLTLERVSTYRGLSSRSIRTLLVHMQSTNKTLHEGTLVEEQVFLDLSAQVMAAHNAGLPLRRHSVDVAGVSSNFDYRDDPSFNSFDSISSFTSDEVTTSGSPSSADGSTGSADATTDLTLRSSMGNSYGRYLFPSSNDGM